MTTFDDKFIPLGDGHDHQRAEIASSLKRAKRRLQKDTGWGGAIAHLVPFYPFYYAYKRDTFTPLCFIFVGNLALAIIYVAFAPYIFSDDRMRLNTFLLIAPTPILTKVGINKARKSGKPLA